jgi:hypothetical protein
LTEISIYGLQRGGVDGRRSSSLARHAPKPEEHAMAIAAMMAWSFRRAPAAVLRLQSACVFVLLRLKPPKTFQIATHFQCSFAALVETPLDHFKS